MNSQPSSSSTRWIVVVGGGAPPTSIRIRPAPGAGAPPSRGRVGARTASTTAGAPQVRVTPWRVDAPQDLGAVHPAQHHLAGAHRGQRVRQPPAVAVEERLALQVDVARATRRRCQPTLAACSQSVRWVSWTPFGRAVVPEV